MVKQRSAVVISVIVAIIGVLVLYIIPSPIDPQPVWLSDCLPALEGPLTVNRHLQKVQRLFQGEIIGPESFAVGPDGSVYTGAADGKIWRIRDGSRLELLARTGIDHPDCGSYQLEPECGRPKGMKVDKQGRLIVVDAYKGVLRVDVNTGETEVLLDSFKGARFLFLNSVDLASDGTIYLTDSSTKWPRRDYRYEVIETNRLGRVIALDPKTRKARLVHDGLYLANGLILSHDESFLLVSEMSVSRITKIYLTGEKAGKAEVLLDNLPGYPDNIKRNDRGLYYVGLGSVRFQGSSPIGSFLDLVGPYPSLKRAVTKLVPAPLFDFFMPRHAMLLEINEKGDIVASHHDPGGHVLSALSEAFQHGNDIYIGHFKIPFVGYIRKSDLGYDNE